MAFRGISSNRGNGVMKTEFPGVVTRRAALGDIGNKVNIVSDSLQDPTLKKTVKQFEDLSLKKPQVGKKQADKLIENKHARLNANAVVLKKQSNVGFLKKPVAAVIPNAQIKPTLKPPCKIPTKVVAKPQVVQEPAAFSVIQLSNVEDIDKGDHHHPELVSELVNDVYNYLRILENKFTIRPNYLQGKEIGPRMRLVLVDWLVQVHMRFHLLQETLFLTIAIIDRVLQSLEITRKKLQLVGVTAMFIAAKYEEMYAPEIADFVYVTDNAYKSFEIRQMENLILRTLDFSLGRPLPLHFLRRNSKAGGADPLLHAVAKYLIELTILEYDMVHYAPSLIAAAASCIAMKMFKSPWSDTLIYYSKYTEKELEPVIRQIAIVAANAKTTKYQAIRVKYTGTQFFKVSEMPELESIVTKLAAEE